MIVGPTSDVNTHLHRMGEGRVSVVFRHIAREVFFREQAPHCTHTCTEWGREG